MIKNWNIKEVLDMIGKVADIRVNGQIKVRSAYIRNLKLIEGMPEVIVYITDKGSGEPGFIKGGAISIESTGEQPEFYDEYLKEILDGEVE